MQVLAAQENDGNKVLQTQILGPRSKKVRMYGVAAEQWLIMWPAKPVQ
jgi:hypothetical protein